MELVIEIAKDFSLWNTHKIQKKFLKNVLKHTLNEFPDLDKVCCIELSILLTNNERMTGLNSEFRKKSKPTNVLSFPDETDLLAVLQKSHSNTEFGMVLKDTADPAVRDVFAAQEYLYLGDLAFGYEIIQQEAMEQNKSFKDHFTHLFVHGVLHLLGFDHAKDQTQAELMQKFEIDILRTLGVQSPY